MNPNHKKPFSKYPITSLLQNCTYPFLLTLYFLQIL